MKHIIELGTGMMCASAVALLVVPFGSQPATPGAQVTAGVRNAAQPLAFDIGRSYPWSVGQGTPINSSGAATAAIRGLIDDVNAAMGASGGLATSNHLGPAFLDLESLRTLAFSQATPSGEPTRINVSDGERWSTGITGLANSTGFVGATTNAALGDPLLADYAGVLQTSNNFGPAFFNLNVLKAVSFTQAPPGAVLPSGALDNAAAVDIGRWSAGVPGIITNTGTTGFVTYRDFGAGPVTDHWVGGLHTTTQVGSMVFDFKFLPAITARTPGPGISFSLAPALTPAGTPFVEPPAPGIIEGLPNTPAQAPVAAAQAPVSAAPDVNDVRSPIPATNTNSVSTSRAGSTTDPVIPGVNGAPLERATGPASRRDSGGRSADPFKQIADAVTKSISTFTGGNKTTPNSTTSPTSGTGEDGRQSSGSGSATEPASNDEG